MSWHEAKEFFFGGLSVGSSRHSACHEIIPAGGRGGSQTLIQGVRLLTVMKNSMVAFGKDVYMKRGGSRLDRR